MIEYPQTLFTLQVRYVVGRQLMRRARANIDAGVGVEEAQQSHLDMARHCAAIVDAIAMSEPVGCDCCAHVPTSQARGGA